MSEEDPGSRSPYGDRVPYLLAPGERCDFRGANPEPTYDEQRAQIAALKIRIAGLELALAACADVREARRKAGES